MFFVGKVFERGSRELPIPKRIERHALMNEHIQPESQLVTDLGTFVSQPVLGQEGCRPTSKEFEHVQERLGEPPFSKLRSVLICCIKPVHRPIQKSE